MIEPGSPIAADYCDVSTAAKRVGLTASYLNNMRHNKKGPDYVKKLNRIYYRFQDLDAWNDERLARKKRRKSNGLKRAA